MKKSMKATQKKVLKSLQTGPKSLNEIRDYLSNIRNINRGGCGVAALAIYDQAIREGKKAKIVFCWDIWSLIFDDGSYERHERYKEGSARKPPACSHVIVKVGHKYYDSDQTFTKKLVNDRFRRRDEAVTREHLVAAIKNEGEWNDAFDRRKNLPKIQKYLGYPLLATK